MVAPLRKKNTIEQTGFKLTENGINYRNNFYDFNEVVEVAMLSSVLEHKIIMVGSEYDYSISIVITLKSGEKLQVTEQSTWFSDSRTSIVQSISSSFSIISEKTWNARIQKYMKQVNDKGFFEYNEWCFYPSQKNIKNIQTNKVYELGSVNLLRHSRCILVKEKNISFISKLIQFFIRKDPLIITITDTDVFFKLLHHYFNLNWQR